MIASRANCQNHPVREAAARCVSCGQPFCRECVTALERRMYCASCYGEKTSVKAKHKRDWYLLSAAAQLAVGGVILWLSAYMLGRLILSVPSSFHEGTVWKKVTSFED